MTSKKKVPGTIFKGATFETSIAFCSIFIQGGQRERDARAKQEDTDGYLSRGGWH